MLPRAESWAKVFHKEGDDAAFLKLRGEAGECVAMRLLAWCMMSNHFHLVLWPRRPRPGRFPIQKDEHLLTVMRHVKRNPVRAKTIPIRKAEH